MTVQDSHAMDLGAAVWATVAFLIADLPTLLPRNNTVS